MDYKTFSPVEDLESFVKCYWTLESAKEEKAQRQRIVPDGCMEMIFHYGDLYKQYIEKGISISQPRCFVMGQLTRPLEIEPTGETGVFSVRFHPTGFLPFSTIPVKEMENTAVSLEKLFGEKGQQIEQEMLDCGTTTDRISIIETFLLNLLADSAVADRIVKATVETILTANGQLSIDTISKQMNINRRQLERKFSLTVGLSPKQLSKIIRLQSALNTLLKEDFANFTAIAYENEYYDQAHFIKDFKEFTGYTPKEFYGDGLKMSSLFYRAD